MYLYAYEAVRRGVAPRFGPTATDLDRSVPAVEGAR
jgi:hypothetical protein